MPLTEKQKAQQSGIAALKQKRAEVARPPVAERAGQVMPADNLVTTPPEGQPDTLSKWEPQSVTEQIGNKVSNFVDNAKQTAGKIRQGVTRDTVFEGGAAKGLMTGKADGNVQSMVGAKLRAIPDRISEFVGAGARGMEGKLTVGDSQTILKGLTALSIANPKGLAAKEVDKFRPLKTAKKLKKPTKMVEKFRNVGVAGAQPPPTQEYIPRGAV